MRGYLSRIELTGHLELDERETRLLNHLTGYDIYRQLWEMTRSSSFHFTPAELQEFLRKVKLATGEILRSAETIRRDYVEPAPPPAPKDPLAVQKQRERDMAALQARKQEGDEQQEARGE